MVVKKFCDFVYESSEPKNTTRVTNKNTSSTVWGPTVSVNAEKNTGQLLPNWNKLTKEEKKLFWSKGPIGRSIRIKAGMKYPDQMNEEQIDLAIELISASLDSFPGGWTQSASFVIDILHFLSYIYRYKNAKTENDKVEYLVISFLSLLCMYLPRQGNMIMTRVPNLVKDAIKRLEILKDNITRPFWGKVVYVITTVMVSQKIYELPDYDKMTKELVEKRKNNPLYGAILGDYDEQINNILKEIGKAWELVEHERANRHKQPEKNKNYEKKY
jgi:hypothetical protein